jgi:hypothetical protein
VRIGAIRRKLDACLEAITQRVYRLAAASMAVNEPGVVVDATRRWTLEQILGEDEDVELGA